MKLKNPRLDYDQKALMGFEALVGVDEAGRGALAGPVVAAAVRLTDAFYRDQQRMEACRGIRDSKKLSENQRENIWELLQIWKQSGVLDFAWALASVGEIEQFNILGATRRAMERSLDLLDQRAVSKLKLPRHDESGLFNGGAGKTPTVRVLVDGKPLKRFQFVHEGIVQGDDKSLAIALASVVAKVQRDHLMGQLDGEFPGYGLAQHKGYGTRIHRVAIIEKGETSVHRPSFLRKFLVKQKEPDVQMDLLLF